MTHERRQLRVRVLEALEGLAKQFRRREELWPLRVPREPVGLDDVMDRKKDIGGCDEEAPEAMCLDEASQAYRELDQQILVRHERGGARGRSRSWFRSSTSALPRAATPACRAGDNPR